MDFTDYNFDYNYNGGGGGGGANSGDTNNNNIQSPHSQTDLLTNYRCVLLNYPVNSSTYPILSYYSLWFINHNPLYPPTDFTPIHHVAFQVAQLIFLVYLTVIRTHSGTGILLLTIYCVVQLLWGVLIIKSIDFLFWNSLNLLVLVIQCARLCFCGGGGSPQRGSSSRRVKSSSKASLVSPSSTGKNSEIDMVYNKLFAPVRVSYKQFLRVVSCKRGFRVLGCGENYALEKRTRVDSLGLLVGGRLVVSQGGKPLHVILPFQFVDSPEYFGVATDELFQVTITALEESKLLVWHRDKLRLTIMNDEFLRVMFDHIIGRDVVRKLIQVSDTIMTTTTTTSCTTSSLFTTTPSSLSPTSPSHNNGQPSNGSTPSGLLTSLTSGQISGSCNPGSGMMTTSTTMMTPNPILMVTRKDKYAYSSSYLTALSEERKVQNGYGVEEEEEDEEEEEEEEEDVEAEEEMPNEEENGGGVLISGNEKEPMLANGNGAEA